jgi:hypothetical protein
MGYVLRVGVWGFMVGLEIKRFRVSGVKGFRGLGA